jgi:hypothetical protein
MLVGRRQTWHQHALSWDGSCSSWGCAHLGYASWGLLKVPWEGVVYCIVLAVTGGGSKMTVVLCAAICARKHGTSGSGV